MPHTVDTLGKRICIDIVRRLGARRVTLLSISVFFSLVLGTILALQAQENRPPKTLASDLPQAQTTEQENSRRIDALERDMVLAKYFMAIARDAAIALGGVATFGLVGFGYLSWRRESRLQENYRQERKFYEMQVERRNDQDAKLVSQQLDIGAIGLTKLDTMLTNQAKKH